MEKNEEKLEAKLAAGPNHLIWLLASQGAGDARKTARYPRNGTVPKAECAEVYIKCIFGHLNGTPSPDEWCGIFHQQVQAVFTRQGVPDPDWIHIECDVHLDHFEMRKENGRWVAIDFNP